MRILCVDDDEPVLQHNMALCEQLPGRTTVKGFTSARDALAWVQKHDVDLALLDIRMPEMDGLTLASRVRDCQPRTALLFVTAHENHALEAFQVHADGYLLKPLTPERLTAEVNRLFPDDLLSGEPSIVVRTFGNFDMMVDGEVVYFTRAKDKELLAYLVDRQGTKVTRQKICDTLWENQPYTRPMQKKLDMQIRSLRATLKEYGIEDILEMEKGQLRVVPEKLNCDLYRLLDGDLQAVNAYQGQYMNAYSWASLQEAYIDRISGFMGEDEE